MLDLIFLAVLGLAVFFSALSAADKEEVVWPVISGALWIFASVSVFAIERIEAFVVDNIAENVKVGQYIADHTITYSGGHYLSLLLCALGIIFFIYAVIRSTKGV